MKKRSGIILIEDNKLALIERRRADRHYFSFPGGGIDKGENPQEAAIREAKEELGILVEIRQKVAVIVLWEKTQHYFLAKKISGVFGTGTGAEYGEYNPAHGTYHPLWMPLADVLTHNVLPRKLADLVVRSAKEGWPIEPVIIVDDKR
jgi:8-oxo-dGTP pyrophosphatase MutT (NUDIX family)